VSAADRIPELYEQHAERFDRERGRSLFERAWLDRFAALMQPGGTILDIGCGSGEPIAAYLIGCGFRLTGLDAAPTLIALCRRRLSDHEWHVADMRSLALGRSFDGMIAWDSFFHLGFDEQRGMFPRFRAHAAPGTVLLFTSGPAHGEAIGSFGGEALYHASLDEAEYRALLDANGFDVVDHRIEDPECGGHTVWLAQAR
jgi:SAM-dependent methyltransferase